MKVIIICLTYLVIICIVVMFFMGANPRGSRDG